MEVEGEDASNFTLVKGNKSFFGRGSGFNTNDHTVSRHHVSFQFNESEPSRVSFQVIGRNPIWVLINKDGSLKLFRKFDKGHLETGDRFCLSGKIPFWFSLKKVQVFEHESSNSELNFDQLDVSGIDPVKEFGFLVMGQEFDQYPKGLIRNVENWQWFIEKPSKESSDEEDFEETRGRKRKIVKDNEDDEWTGDSEDDKDLVAKMGKGKKPQYSTRSKDKRGPNKDVKANKHSKRKKVTTVNETDEEDDNDDDETLGGFIVTDDEEDDEEEKEEEENDEEEEEEFEEDDDDDDDEDMEE